MIRRASTFNTERINHLYQDPHENERRLFLHYGDLNDGSRISSIVSDVRPDEVYNLAAQSHVRVSFDEPVHTGEVTGIGLTRLLDAVLSSRLNTRIYQASSSEMFGAELPPQNEKTRFYPRSPYGAAKLYAHWMTANYREAHGIFAVSGILFNHESPRRGPTFVTRKITRAVARIQAGLQDELHLGNLEAKRDWGYAPDYVVGMWRMLQQDEPQDTVIGTGKSVSVKEFLDLSFRSVGLDWQQFTKFDSRYLRPTEVDHLMADPAVAESRLGMNSLVSINELAREMVEHDTRSLGGFVPDKPIGKLWKEETAG